MGGREGDNNFEDKRGSAGRKEEGEVEGAC